MFIIYTITLSLHELLYRAIKRSISVAIGGMLKRHLSPDMLRKLLENELLDSEKQEKSRLAAIRDMWKGGAGK